VISQRLIRAVRLSGRRQYEIAHSAKLHPSTLSKILNGIEIVRPGDPRVLRLGKVLGIPERKLFARRGRNSAKGDVRSGRRKSMGAGSHAPGRVMNMQ